MSRSPMMGASGFVHVAAAPCVILRRMAAESACPQRRAVPKSLTERYVAVVTVMSYFWVMAIRPNRLQRYKILSNLSEKKRRNFR